MSKMKQTMLIAFSRLSFAKGKNKPVAVLQLVFKCMKSREMTTLYVPLKCSEGSIFNSKFT